MSMMPNIPSDYLLGAGDGLPSPCNQHWDTPLLGRALLIGRPCLVYECLREAMNLRGIETHVGPFEKPFSLSVSEYEYDVLVIFMTVLTTSSALTGAVTYREASATSESPGIQPISVFARCKNEVVGNAAAEPTTNDVIAKSRIMHSDFSDRCRSRL